MAERPRVLVCEDESLSLTALEMLLCDEGFAVEPVSDGAAALDAAGHGGFDLVMTDLQVPKVDGRDLVQGLRNRLPRVPIIVMTGRPPEEGEAALAGQGGALLLFKKPIDFDVLVGEARRLVDGESNGEGDGGLPR